MESTRVKYGTTERVFATATDSSGDSLTGLTNVKLEIYRKSDGKYFDFNDETFKTSGWTTRQGVMTELSASLSPGVYYYDFDTTDHTSQFVEETFLMTMTSATAANDPTYGELKVGGYVDQIGISGGVVQYGKGKGMTETQIKKFAEEVWKVVLDEKRTAGEVLLSKSEFDAVKDKVMMDIKFPEFPEIPDRYDEVLTAIGGIEKPKDFTKDIQSVGKKVEGVLKEIQPIVKDFAGSVKEFKGKMELASQEINSSMQVVAEIKAGFEKLAELTKQYEEKLAEQSDMDKRFDAMASALNKKNLEDLAKEIQATQKELKKYVGSVLKNMTELKYEVLQELNSK